MSRSARNSEAKAAYSRPTLKVYGGVTKLTASGTLEGNENTGSMANEMS